VWKVVVDFAENQEGKYLKMRQELRWSITPPKRLLGRYKSSHYHLILSVNNLVLEKNTKCKVVAISINRNRIEIFSVKEAVCVP
jgi:hypothetical protein